MKLLHDRADNTRRWDNEKLPIYKHKTRPVAKIPKSMRVTGAVPATSSRTTGPRPSSRSCAGTTGTSSPIPTFGRGASKVCVHV